jgi:NTE family protein
MAKLKIAIACQGGGSQTAFTAGALKKLCEARPRGGDEFDVVAISGTSGGAVCAALLWFARLMEETPPWQRMIDFWEANTAQGPMEQFINDSIVQSMRLINSGLMPTLQLSPSSPVMQMAMQFMMAGQRKAFADFRALLEEHIDFAKIAKWGPRTDQPVLMIGAANVTTGSLVKFMSSRDTIRVENILASCCVPSIFPAVEIAGDAYWDGLFSDNPPVEELVRARSVGPEYIPDEIWVIKINPTEDATVPATPNAIFDRRNQVEGNISLFQQLTHLEMINDMIMQDAFRPEFLERFDIQAPVRIPRASMDSNRPYHIPFIEMPKEVQDKLDYEGKIDRSPQNIQHLIAEGEKAAAEFLRKREEIVAASPLTISAGGWRKYVEEVAPSKRKPVPA